MHHLYIAFSFIIELNIKKISWLKRLDCQLCNTVFCYIDSVVEILNLKM